MTRKNLSIDRLKEVLTYDECTGVFTWKVNKSSGAMAGVSICGNNGEGYVRVCIDGVRYKAHRLAWFYVKGIWPSSQIDHINGVPADNRISNLREATRAENMQNQRRAHSNNKASGLLGVYPTHNKKNPWKAQISINGKHIRLGNFPTAERAQEAYVAAKREMHKGCTI